jgi:opacity protein-like surface antigen
MRKLLWTAVLSLLLVAPGHAGAEGFFDLFAGAAFTDSNDVKISAFGVTTTTDSDFKTSFSVGGRFGYWFSFFGLNLDVNYFRPDPGNITVAGFTAKTDLDVVGIGVNAMLRARLVKTSAVPDGALQPYIFGGPTAFITKLDVDVPAIGESDVSVDANLGFTAGTGVTFMLTKNFGLFGEYRFTYNRPTFGDSSDLKIEPKLNSHHLLGGVTLRF